MIAELKLEFFVPGLSSVEESARGTLGREREKKENLASVRRWPRPLLPLSTSDLPLGASNSAEASPVQNTPVIFSVLF